MYSVRFWAPLASIGEGKAIPSSSEVPAPPPPPPGLNSFRLRAPVLLLSGLLVVPEGAPLELAPLEGVAVAVVEAGVAEVLGVRGVTPGFSCTQPTVTNIVTYNVSSQKP